MKSNSFSAIVTPASHPHKVQENGDADPPTAPEPDLCHEHKPPPLSTPVTPQNAPLNSSLLNLLLLFHSTLAGSRSSHSPDPGSLQKSHHPKAPPTATCARTLPTPSTHTSQAMESPHGVIPLPLASTPQQDSNSPSLHGFGHRR